MDYKTDIEPILTSLLRHGLTTVAGMLAVNGAIQENQVTQFVTIGSAVVIWAAGQGWAVWQKRHQKALVATTAVLAFNEGVAAAAPSAQQDVDMKS
ncbi:MAG: hypothetical protein KA744_04075 [Phenylobacterium sp.]|nr:hypothetical protein [Phenylobacterium sp.]MBP9755129.1 hypothetical protein [Phenylobacterium sp.]